MQFPKQPKLVVFDLDFTLWDAGGLWCDCTCPPYHVDEKGRVVDSMNRHIRLYQDVFPILKTLRSRSIPIALASRTDQPGWANQLTALLGMDAFIDYRKIYPGSKTQHLSEIELESAVSCPDMVFFDDEYRNIRDTQSMGVRAVLVKNGIQAQLFTDMTGIRIVAE